MRFKHVVLLLFYISSPENENFLFPLDIAEVATSVNLRIYHRKKKEFTMLYSNDFLHPQSFKASNKQAKTKKFSLLRIQQLEIPFRAI